MNRRTFLTTVLGLAAAPFAAKALKETPTPCLRGGRVRGGLDLRDDVPTILPQGYAIRKSTLSAAEIAKLQQIVKQWTRDELVDQIRSDGFLRTRT